MTDVTIINLPRLRDFVLDCGANDQQRARALGINWATVREVLAEDGNPKLATLLKIAARMPADTAESIKETAA